MTQQMLTKANASQSVKTRSRLGLVEIAFQKIDAYLASHPTQFRKKSLFLSFDDDLNELVLTLMGSNFMTLRIYFGGTETLGPTIKHF